MAGHGNPLQRTQGHSPQFTRQRTGPLSPSPPSVKALTQSLSSPLARLRQGQGPALLSPQLQCPHLQNGRSHPAPLPSRGAREMTLGSTEALWEEAGLCGAGRGPWWQKPGAMSCSPLPLCVSHVKEDTPLLPWSYPGRALAEKWAENREAWPPNSARGTHHSPRCARTWVWKQL